MNVTGRKARVRWTDEEVTQLAEEVAMLRLGNPLPALTELLNQAQLKLPEQRRRAINSVANVPGFTEKVRLCVDALIAKSEQTEAPKEPTPEPPSPAQIVRQAPTALLVAELATRLVGSMEQLATRVGNIEAALASRTVYLNGHAAPQAPPKPEPPVAAKPPRKLRVCVVGLLSVQMETMSQECKTRGLDVELRFVSKNVTAPEFPSSTDLVFLFTKFIDHAWQNAAFNTFGHDRVIRHAGGVDRAVEVLAKAVKDYKQ